MNPGYDEARLESLRVSENAKTQLRSLLVDLTNAVGQDLKAACVYGSAARGEWHEQTSDLNLLLVLREIDYGQLDAIAATIERARKKLRLAPMVLTENEVRRAADVFCIKFADIQRHHVCLVGSDPLAALQIDPSELRFVCEFELRNISMRLRAAYLRSHRTPVQERELLLRFFSHSLFPLRTLSTLLGQPTPEDTPGSIDAIGAALDFDVEVLQELWEVHRTNGRLDQATQARLYRAFSDLIALSVHRSDQLRP